VSRYDSRATVREAIDLPLSLICTPEKTPSSPIPSPRRKASTGRG
jgi:hypothetical protein